MRKTILASHIWTGASYLSAGFSVSRTHYGTAGNGEQGYSEKLFYIEEKIIYFFYRALPS